ncbi:MAG: ornithine--oxo-acid transaminase [Anaerolineaceae bacterium]|nr:ornithine--oxo-acid transaminase [Anaerolineaceae bacterium]
MKTRDYINIEDQYGAHNYHPLDVVISKADGVWVYDVENKKYLDCLSAYSAVNHGHVHPRILNAMIQQASKVTLTSRAFRNDQLGLFYKELAELTGYEKSLPMNSGAEAVETAIKLARKWAYQVKKTPKYDAEIIVAEGNFHGRTLLAISASTEQFYKEEFGPFVPGIVHTDYNDIQAMENAITPNTAAILLEPIQGEAGIIVPDKDYLSKVAAICKKNNILLIVDEIQTGLGRTGKLFAHQYDNVRPDMVIIGKALSAGFYPVSAVLADAQLMDLFLPGEHGSTFGGNPLAAAIGRESLKVLIEENLIEKSKEMGDYFQDQLAEINSKHVKEVRGKGLLIGIELKPEANGARRFCEALQDEGILAKETHENVIRFAPPLVIDKETIDWALPKIRKVLAMP